MPECPRNDHCAAIANAMPVSATSNTDGAFFSLGHGASRAALFAVAGVHFGGLVHAAALGVAFTTGMLVVDGLNGVWMWKLIARADRTSRMASRAMGLFLGTLSLAAAAYGAARY